MKKLLSGKIRLPSPPAIAIKILETVRKDNFTFHDLADVIKSDPALAARILRVANSPYYNPADKVTSIEKALSILGSHAVQNIALSFIIFTEFHDETGDTFDSVTFWQRALTAAVAAELTASRVGKPIDDIFITALLQDIGVMVMHCYHPRYYQEIFTNRYESGNALHQVEKKMLGFDHQQLGSELLKQWHLPEEIYGPISLHHENQLVPEQYRTQVDIMRIADCLSAFYNSSQNVDEIRMVRSILDTSFGLQGKAVDSLIEDVAEKALEMFSLYEIVPGGIRPFSLILQEANEELSKLYDSYELQIIELKQAKEKAEKLARELHDANEKHRELAFRDGLTGIYNQRFFQKAMDREYKRAQRYGREFSLILFDVDHLKKINDTYGHTVGDLVLLHISKAVERVVRATDVFARCGGDEFAVIMPETDVASATIVAEHLRDCVEAMTIAVDNVNIKVTISTGLTSYSSAAGVQDKIEIISMADKALYNAKRSGKNRVHTKKFSQK